MRRYTEAEISAFVGRATSAEKCLIAIEYIEKIDYLDPDFLRGWIEQLNGEYMAYRELEDEPETDREYTHSVTGGDYSASCPWNAPGMKVGDFI